MCYAECENFIRIVNKKTGLLSGIIPMYQLILYPGKKKAFDNIDRTIYGCFCGCNGHEILNTHQLFEQNDGHSSSCNIYRKKLVSFLSSSNFQTLAFIQGCNTIKVSFSWEPKSSQKYEPLLSRPSLHELHQKYLDLKSFIYLMQCLAYDKIRPKLQKSQNQSGLLQETFNALIITYLSAYTLENKNGTLFPLASNIFTSNSGKDGIYFLYSEVIKFFPGKSNKFVYAILNLPTKPIISINLKHMECITRSKLNPNKKVYIAGFIRVETISPYFQSDYSKLIYNYINPTIKTYTRNQLLRAVFFNADDLGFINFSDEQPYINSIPNLYHTFYPTTIIPDTGVISFENNKINILFNKGDTNE